MVVVGAVVVVVGMAAVVEVVGAGVVGGAVVGGAAVVVGAVVGAAVVGAAVVVGAVEETEVDGGAAVVCGAVVGGADVAGAVVDVTVGSATVVVDSEVSVVSTRRRTFDVVGTGSAEPSRDKASGASTGCAALVAVDGCSSSVVRAAPAAMAPVAPR